MDTPKNISPIWRSPKMISGLLLMLALAAFIAGIFLSSSAAPATSSPTSVSVTQAMQDVASHQVKSASVDDTTNELYLHMDSGRLETTTLPQGYVGPATDTLVKSGVPLSSAAVTGDMSTPAPATPLHLLGLTLILLAVAAAVTAGALALQRSRRAGSRSSETAAPVVSVPTTRFSDVAGCAEAIEDLREIVTFLREPERFERTGAKIPKGALLCGPPGTGKTLLARAVAGEAGVAFHAVAGSDFVEKYVGVGAKRVRSLFAEARKSEKAIIFIDEIDAVARRRGGETEGAGVEHESTLIALLNEMDGFSTSQVIVIAATNRADVLDPALLRPGRLDRRVEVPNPDRRGREQILKVHASSRPVAKAVDFLGVARRTPGFSGAQLEAVVNEACMQAARLDLDEVTQDCFDHAVASVAMGRARTSALVTEHDRRITAWHEAGHTLAALLIPEADDPVQVTIVPRGPAGGVTWMSGNDDIFLPRRKALAQLVVALAGRAAEELLLDGEYTQGASGDLQSATNLALQMTTQYGMTRLGYMVRDTSSPKVSEVVEELLSEAHTRALDLLTAHRSLLESVAERLLDEETLTLADVKALAQHTPRPHTSPVAQPWGDRPEVLIPTQRTPLTVGVPERRRRGLVAAVARYRRRSEEPVL